MKNPRRELIIVKKDGSTVPLRIAKAVKIKTPKPILHLDQLKDGNYRLVWSEGLIDEFSEIDRFDIVREG